MDRVRVHMVVHGRVQGVWFRESTRQQAAAIGAVGWVRNLPDGTVEILAEGSEAQVEQLVQWARTGPKTARVDEVAVRRGEATGEFAAFSVTR